MDFTIHPYTTAADLQAMCDLVLAVRAPERLSDFPSLADLQEAMRQDEVANTVRLWRDPSGVLVAFAFINEGNLVFEMQPYGWDTPSLGDAIVTYAIDYLSHTPDPPETLDASCRAEDSLRIALLERNRFIRDSFDSMEMTRSLAGILPEPSLPEDFMFRPLDSERELEAVVDLHRAAFGTQNLTIEARRAWMGSPDYNPALDLVVVAPDGRLAGYCFCQFSRVENELTGKAVGYTDPVAVHPDFQRLGLARALLLKGMRLLRDRNLEIARLGTSSENLAMQKAAEAAGFKVESRKIWWTRPLK